ncbi:hypothetical protein Ga0080574_TMP1399 [Salipiger abyssi]|uniref:Uncharacterized protein n=1 Tax=Salipiger abyssi TaxID=1250539 RepID=A0A1P8UQR7_9RHOB|nr:hypothetical protein Ga0080574_TMP1399 [Salipiger abyssi]
MRASRLRRPSGLGRKLNARCHFRDEPLRPSGADTKNPVRLTG